MDVYDVEDPTSTPFLDLVIHITSSALQAHYEALFAHTYRFYIHVVLHAAHTTTLLASPLFCTFCTNEVGALEASSILRGT